ncbi:FoF1 ATP synthase subunit a [Lachnospiraceae bacterium 54-53]
MNLEITGAEVFYVIPVTGGIPITETIVNTWIVMALIMGLCLYLTHDLREKATTKRQILAEYIVIVVTDFVKGNMGARYEGFAPFVAALFSLSAFSSLSGMLGAYPPTSDLSTVLGWAVMVFVMITFTKIKTTGVKGYATGFTQPIFILTPFNIISEIATPISMAFRHFGNIASGTIISTLVYGALAALSHAVFGSLPGILGAVLGEIPFFQIGIPAFLSIYFDLFSSLLQAFIFCMLTMMYIASAAEEN